MVAMVGGAGLGLSNTSRELAGAAAGLGEAALGRGPERVTLNAATGNLVVQSRDEFLVGTGTDLELLRSYNSQGGWDGDNGDGWRIGYYRRVGGLTGTLGAAGSTIRRVEADGHEAVYTYDGGRYVGREGAGAHDALVFDAAARVWTWTDGDRAIEERYVETAAGSGVFRLVQVTNSEGHATKIAYDAAGLVTGVASWKAGASSADESVALQYDGATRRLTQITTHYQDAAGGAQSRVRVRYEYDTDGRLSLVRTDLTPEDGQVADGRVYTVRYGYDAAGRIASVAQADGSSLAIDYDASGRVRRLVDALGRATTLSYDSVARRTTVTDALEQVTLLAFDATDRLAEISGAAAGGPTLRQSFTYDADGDLVSSRNPAGEETVFEHTASGALSRSTDAAGNVVERHYDGGNRLVSELRYAVADPDGAAGPAVASAALRTRYLYDTGGGKGRLRFVVDPDGRVTQLDYNALGQVGVRTHYADARYTATAEPILAELEAWAAGLSAAQRAAVERSEYGYDLRGQQVSIRTYSANSVSGGSVVYGGLAEQRHVYDAFGRLLQSIDALGQSTVMAYDGLDRLITTTDATQATTLRSYDDAGNRLVLRLAHGLEQVSTYDRAGRLVASADRQGTTVLGETRYFYDALDRLTMTQDPTGLRRWTLHDSTGRRTAEIDAGGRFVEHLYDAAGRLVQSVDHAVPLGATALAGLVDAASQPVARTATELRPAADPARDRVVTRFHDRAGRLVALQDADGAITETQYDGASRTVTTIAYANLSAITRLDTAGGSVVAPPAYAAVKPASDPARDRIGRSFYSDAGLLRATLDAEGYLVERRYDAASRLVEQIAYANATPAASRASGTLAQLLPSAGAADRRSLWLYDGRGQLVGALDADGYLTEIVYDAHGNRRQSIRYSTPVVSPVPAGATLAALRPAPSAADRSTRWELDRLNRVLREIAPDGTATRHDYDAGGRLVSSVRAEGTAEARTQTRRFDLQGRVVAELSAEGAGLLTAGQTTTEVDAVWAAHGSSTIYDAAGRRIARRDADGSVTVYYHDAAGREVCSILKTGLGGEIRQIAYNAFGEAETETTYANRLAPADLAALAGGRIDAALAGRIAALADASRDLRSTTLRTRRSEVAQAIDALGQRTDYQYTAFGQLASFQEDVSAGARLRTDRGYDRRGLLLSTTADPGGIAQRTSSGYDAFGRVTSTVDARGQHSNTQYSKASLAAGGRSVAVSGPTGTQTTVYDAFDGVVQQTDALGHTVRYLHDAKARKLTLTTAEGVVNITETSRHGQVVRITDGTGAVTHYTYDRDGRLLTTADAAGNLTQNRYDAVGNLLAMTAGLKSNGGGAPTDTGSATTTEYLYDAARRVLIRRVDPDGLRLETRYEYDGRGRAVRSTDPAGIVTTSNFDAAGRLRETVVDSAAGGLQLRTTYGYDAQGRILSVTEGAGSAAARTTETRYDALGRRTAEIVDPAGLALTRSWEHDGAGLVVLERDALGQPTRHVHDAAGRLKLTIDATGSVTQRLYDAAGRLIGLQAYAQRLGGGALPDLAPAALSDAQIESAVAALAGQADALTQYVLDKDDRVVYTIDAVGAVTQNRYDKANRVVETLRYATLKPGAWSAGSAPILDAARDQSTLTVHDAIGRVRYVVDALDFVTETVYDRQGRATLVKRYARSITRPAAATEAAVAAALSGRLDAANDRSDFYAYDAAGRLRFAVDAEGYVTERRYDALGRVTDTLRSQVKAGFATAPTLAQAEAVFRTTRGFTGGATGVSGTAHVYEANRIRLVSRPEAGGGYASTRSSAAALELGGSVAFDLTPLGLQPELVVGIESPSGVPLTRFGIVLGADGRIDAQTIDRATGIDKRVDLGAYVAGTAYRVEMATSDGGAVLYVHERGKARDSGLVHRSDEPLSWSAFSVVFHANRDPALAGESSATVDELVESRAALLSQDRYDAAGRLAASIDGEGVVTRYTYDAAGRLLETIAAAGLPEASITRRLYDAAGRLLEETTAHGSAAASTTRYEYDAEGRLVARVDPRGIALARSDGVWAQSERAALGFPATLAALSAAQKQALSDRYTTRYEYDAAGRRIRTSEPLGRVTGVAYDAFGNAVSRSEPDASGTRVSYAFYDRLGRAVQEVDAERYLTTHGYDAFGNRTETLRYDRRVAGTITPQSTGGPAIAVLTADPGDGRAHVIAAPAADAATRSSFDRRNQRLTERDAEGHVEGGLEALDAFGQRRSLTNRLGGRASYTYDRLGRLVRETLPVRAAKADGTLIDVVNQYGYDGRGNRVLSVEAAGLPEQRSTHYRFDNENRQVRRTGMAYLADDGSNVAPADRLRYDALGRLIEQVTGGRVVDNAVLGGRRSLAWYDARGLRTAEVSADAVLAQFTHDPAGNPVIQRIAATRLAGLPAPPGGSAPSVAASATDRKLSYVFDALGRRTQSALDGVWHWEFGQPVTLPGAERITLERLSYDAAGNVVQRTDARGHSSYAYFDDIGRQVLAIDAEGYVTAWEHGRSLQQATREIRYAGRLAGGYARQDDATAPAVARDPQALRGAAAAASAALPAGQAEADRVSSFVLDRLGRVIERRVADVAVEDVRPDGTRTQRVADAVVRTVYDGLGHVTQTRELVGDASDPAASAWEVTDIGYDLLGRETARRAPGFVDFEGAVVRPSTDTEYDGLGQVERRIQRGKTAGGEAEDRIVSYRYDGNGRLLEERDAAGALTRYAHDAAGNLVLRTAVAVRRSDGTARDLGTRYGYDAAGRVVAETDLDTGELRRTRYNAFGDVAARGLGDGWQEFAEYTTLGKVWKTNAGDGAVKIYLHDRNGNTTREIKAAAAVDLRPVGLAAASHDATLLHSTSLYDKRNLLRQTLEPEFELLASTVTLGQQFVEQWVPQYGDLNTAAGTSQQASIQDGQRYTTVSAGAAALTPLGAVAPGFAQATDGVILGAGPVQATPAVPAVMTWHALSHQLPTGTYRSDFQHIRTFSTQVALPADWPAGEYRVTETAGSTSYVLTTTAAPGDPVSIGGTGSSAQNRSLQFDYRFASTEPWTPIATAQFTKLMDMESYQVDWRGLTVTTQPDRRLVLDTHVWGAATSFKVFLDPDAGAPTALAVKAFGSSTRFDAVDLPATLTGAHTLRIVALDAAGKVRHSADYAIGSTAKDASGNPLPTEVSTLTPKTALKKGTDGFVWVDYTGGKRTLRYESSGTDLGAGTSLKYRRAVTNGRGAWASVALSGNAVDLGPLALADGNYEFVVEFGATFPDLHRYGKFTVHDGSVVVANPMLQRVTRRSEQVSIAGPSGGTVTLALGAHSASATVASGATSAAIDLGALRQKLGIDRWSAGTAAYVAISKDAAGKVTHADRGVFTFGSLISVPSSDGGNAIAATDGVTEYQPEASLTVAGAAGRVVVTPKTGGGTAANWPADGTDWRVRRQGDGLVVNLRQWLPAWGAAANTVQLRYEGNDGLIASVDFTVAANGTVTRASTVVQQTNKPQLPLVVPGATSLRVFKVGLDDASVDAVTANEPVSGTGPNFVWNASSRIGQTLRYYYEAVDAAGKLVGRGRGKVVIAANGDITQTPDAPLPIPYVRFSPPTGTTSFTLQIRPQGSTSAYTAYTNAWASGNDRIYDFESKKPASGTAVYDYLFTAKDASSRILTKGSGTLGIQSSGAISVTNVEEHVAVPVLFKLGRQVPKALLTVERNGVPTSVTLAGTWVPPVVNADGSPGRLGYTLFNWDAASMGSASGVTTYDYTLVAHDAAGSPVLDEIGRAVAQSGRIELDPSGSQPVQLLQQVEALNNADSVIVSRLQSHNAFGEVVEERDERVADRMAAMLGRALTAAEQAAARTTLRYDTRGRLLSRTDPQTHITLANGHRYRDRPVTRYGYDLLGRLSTATDANGNLSRQLARAGARGDESPSTAEFFVDGGQRHTAYDVFGDARRIVDAEGHVVEQSFDRLSRLVQSDRREVRRVIDGSGSRGAGTTLSSRYTYDQLGRRLSQTDAAGQTIRTDYDGLGRVVRTESGQGFETSYRYENVDAGAAGGVLGVGGANVGGTRLTTTRADGRNTIDKIDYFGHTTWHQDLSGAQTVYSYDRAARLVAQQGAAHAGQPGAQDIRYAYYANGFVQSVTDLAVGSVSEYGYDNAGNRIYEAYFQLVAGNKSANYQNASLSYDELNRQVGVRDSNYFDIRYEYDANGNRRLVESVYWDGLAGLRSGRQTYWYDYDGMNRFVVTKGALSGARATSRTDTAVRVVAGAEGTVLAYDRLGQRRSATYTHQDQQVAESYGYSEDGYLETVSQGGELKAVRMLDAIGRTVQYHDQQNRTLTVSSYDRDSRLTQQVHTDSEEVGNSGTTTYAYYSDDSDSASDVGGAGALAKTVFTPDDSDGTTVTTSYRYVYWDEAKQREILKQADNPDLPTWAPGGSWLYYNANGHLERVSDGAASLDTLYFNSANGLILKREKLQNGSRVGSHFYYYADGRRVGDVSDDPSDNPRISYAEQLATKHDKLPDPKKLYKTFKPVSSADFDQNFEPINESYPGAAPSSYTVRDTRDLQGIALQLWGDRSMWYLIAEANGLRGDETLASGQVLVIPNKVTNIHNNAETFRPYNPGEAIGRIDPTLPPAPTPKDGGCGGIGIAISIAIAVAVTAVTGGAAATAIGQAFTVSAGSLGAGAATVAGYAAGAALGSVASQGFNMAAGLQDGFSWRPVGQAALAGGIGAGVTAAAGSIEALSFLKEGALAAAGRAAIGSGINQALHGDWDWRGVMASAVGAGVSFAVGAALRGTFDANAGGEFGRRLVAGVAGAAAARFMLDRPRALNGVFVATLGSVLGDEIGSAIAPHDDHRQSSDLATSLIDDLAVQETSLTATQPAGNSVDSGAGPLVHMDAKQGTGDSTVPLKIDDKYSDHVSTTLHSADETVVNDADQFRSDQLSRLRSQLNEGTAWKDDADGYQSDGSFRLTIYGVGRRDIADSDIRPGLQFDGANSSSELPSRFADGLLGAIKGVAVEPFAQLYDLSLAGASFVYNEAIRPESSAPWLPELKSGMSEAYANGASQFRLLLQSNPLTGIGVLSYDLTAAVQNGDWGSAAEISGGLVGGFAVGKATQRYGGYGVAFEHIGATGPMASQMGAVAPKLISPRSEMSRLTYLGSETWQSPAGLQYGPDALYGNRVLHVLRHATDQPERVGQHGVFDVPRSQVVGLVDEAWMLSRQSGANVIKVTAGSKEIYTIDMGRRIGWVGGQWGAALGHPPVSNIQLVVRNRNEIVTAYPIR